MKNAYGEGKARSDVSCPRHNAINFSIQKEVNRDLAEKLAKRDEKNAFS